MERRGRREGVRGGSECYDDVCAKMVSIWKGGCLCDLACLNRGSMFSRWRRIS